MFQPLPTENLQDAGIPAWADTFIHSFALDGSLLDLAEAADFLGLKMLRYLCLARIAVEIKRGGDQALLFETPAIGRGAAGLDARKRDSANAKFETALKKQNEWSWKEKDTDVCADDGDVSDAALEEVVPDTASGRISAWASALPFPFISPDARKHGIHTIIKDGRISSKRNDTVEKLRLLSSYAGGIALFL